ncbi:unnamed protein product [Lepeophtheirus salmonis]|uniref:(salmon louse) hypothetical protein n=1 Tax=Lepeophtheirus salmonis TaxID=72036 RepID=A0A7R8H1L3_LEPSM|nr:unnamed protein product [Lepeophtheirus salmonis]CAF2809279.1 unnamed protein product [Lepeophtheirus salmonis]
MRNWKFILERGVRGTWPGPPANSTYLLRHFYVYGGFWMFCGIALRISSFIAYLRSCRNTQEPEGSKIPTFGSAVLGIAVDGSNCGSLEFIIADVDMPILGSRYFLDLGLDSLQN